MIDSKQTTTCSSIHKDDCSQCTYATGADAAHKNISGIFTLTIILGLVSYYFFKHYKKKYILVIGTVTMVFLLASSFVHSSNEKLESSVILASSTSPDEFHEAGDEFISQEASQEFDNEDEFKEVDDEFSSVGSDDEFESSDEFSSGNLDEFSEDMNELSGITEGADSKISKKDRKHLIELAVLLGLIIVISLFIRNAAFRKLRPLFLLAMVVWLGFARGGCPCMISSFHNTVLAGMGNHVSWVSMLWFLGLLPATYFLGKIWCGWLCHLGGLQEFLFSATKLEFLTKSKHQKVIKIVQIAMFVVLLVQIIVTHTNIYIHYDPFKVAFNLFSANTTGYVLLAIMLISSVLVYRPFCRAFCPVGLVLGVVAMLPKSRKIVKTQDCIDCIRCSKECKSNAIIYENKTSQLNTSNCIVCGDCLGHCHKNALDFSTK